MITKKSIIRILSILSVIAILLATTPFRTAHAVGTRYARPNATGAGNCSDWGNACTLQTALTGAASGDEIWVAAGKYRPTSGTDRTATFQLKNGVAVYGGFAGTEVGRTQRNPALNITILSGDLKGDDVGFTNNSENSYTVVTGTGTDGTSILDGFTITAGYSTNSGGYGGGIYNNPGSPTLSNLTISGNSAFSGGGMINGNGSHPTIMNTTFSNNTANWAGGMYNGSSTPTLTNVTFNGNSAAAYGGGIYNISSSPVLTNVTFKNNFSGNQGGGMLNVYSSPRIRNTIFWDNIATTAGAQIYNSDASSSPVVSNSVVQDGCPARTSCTNILTTDPKIGPLGNFGGNTQTVLIQAGSSAIDTGDDSTCPPTDQRGVPRPQGSHCDIGAYEYNGINFNYVLFVKPVAAGVGDCMSWANACTLQTALTYAPIGIDEIWVAGGTYRPTTGPDRTATFHLKDGVALYGGFVGTESGRDQRDPTLNVTILSGDIGIAANNSDNTYHVVTGATGGTLDGFTITAGNAVDSTSAVGFGGGMLNQYSSPTLTNVIFSGNRAMDGGGMYNDHSSPTLINVGFYANTALYDGGGMDCQASSPTLTIVGFAGNSAGDWAGGMLNNDGSPKLTYVTFSGNQAVQGGGMSNDYGNPILTNVTFTGNIVSGDGGGMYDDSDATLANVTFYDNHAAHGGGIYLRGRPTLTNLTFNSNIATSSGGGMYSQGGIFTMTNATFSSNSTLSGTGMGGGIYSGGSSWLSIINTIFWDNTASSGTQVFTEYGSHTTESYNVVQGGCPAGSTCTNILVADPVLGSLGNYGGFTQTIPLLAGSSAIDTGDDTVCPAADQRGLTRPQWTHCDIGAYEYWHPDTTGPTVNIFTVTTLSNSLTIPITTFSATDDLYLAGYLITTDPTQPNASAAGWTSTPPATFTVASDGIYTLYPWAKDGAGNVSAVFTSPSAVMVDTTAPTVVSSLRADPNYTIAASVDFTVMFSEPVTGVDVSDFSLTTRGVAGASVSAVSGSGNLYTVAVNIGSGTGTLRLDMPAGANITDQIGNPLAGLPYTGGATYTICNEVFTFFLPLAIR